MCFVCTLNTWKSTYKYERKHKELDLPWAPAQAVSAVKKGPCAPSQETCIPLTSSTSSSWLTSTCGQVSHNLETWLLRIIPWRSTETCWTLTLKVTGCLWTPYQPTTLSWMLVRQTYCSASMCASLALRPLEINEWINELNMSIINIMNIRMTVLLLLTDRVLNIRRLIYVAV